MSEPSLSTDTRSAAKSIAREWSLAGLVSVCVSLAVVAPFFFRGTASGHDVAFHMASWLDAALQWKQGVVFPRWTQWANFGYGEPRFIFYPPLSWMLGALLGTVLPWQSVALIFNFCVQTFAGLSAYGLLRRVVDTRFARLFGSACFAANPYALLIIYMRSDFAELLAIAFFPLLLLATLRLAGGATDCSPEARFRELFAFAICFCAVWLANAPAAVIATYSVALAFALATFLQRSAKPLLRGASSMALGFCFAGFYLVPAIYEQRWVNISGALAGGLTPAENFIFARTSDTEHDAFNRIASQIAVLLVAWAIVAGFATWRGRAAAAKARGGSNSLAILAALGATAFILMLPVTKILWQVLPELRFVQFPWRWMSMLALCAMVLTAWTAQTWARWVWLVAAAIALSATGYFLVEHAWWDTEDMPTLQEAVRSGAGFEGTDEYDPMGDDHTDLAAKQARAVFLASPADAEAAKEARITVQQWDAEHRRIGVNAHRAGRMALHIVDYPAWRVTLNGHKVSPQHAKNTEQMIVPVPAGESELRVDFTRTWDRTIGGWISITSLLGCAGTMLVRRRTRKTAGI